MCIFLGVSTSPVNVLPTTDGVVPEGQGLIHEVEVAPRIFFLQVPEFEETENNEPPDWLLDKDEAPLEPGVAAALPRRVGPPPPMAEGPPETAAAAEGRLAPPERRRQKPPSSRPVWRPSTLPKGSAAGTRAADKQYYQNMLAQHEESVKLERRCLLAKLKALEEEVRVATAACKATELLKTGICFRERATKCCPTWAG